MTSFAPKIAMISFVAGLGFLACARTAPTPPSANPSALTTDAATDASPADASTSDATTEVAIVDAAPLTRAFGPYELPLSGKRKVYYAVSQSASGTHRVIANLHGMCNPPGYACGYWLDAGTKMGFMICPEGNTVCGAGGPSSWDESFTAMDGDLEAAIRVVDVAHPGELSREGSILTAFSRGAYAAPIIAGMHPGRWPYLILAEADVSLSAYALRKAGVKAVVLLAGEWGTQIKGERETVKRLQNEHFPALFLTMKKAGHYYSADIDDLMSQAIAFVLAAVDAVSSADSGAADAGAVDAGDAASPR
ncbi:hypothetical protein BH09MYX1_BH09MYX1_27730 [soil metagenome]